MHSSYIAKGRTVDVQSFVTTAERTPTERMKHSNTAAVYLVQGRVDSAVRILVINDTGAQGF